MSNSKKSSKSVNDSSQLPAEELGSSQMIIVPDKGEKISPLQSKFNQLVKNIDLFERTIAEQEQAFVMLRQKLLKTIIPLENEIMVCMIDTLKLLSEYIDDPFFNKKQKDFFRQFITDRIEEIPVEIFEHSEYGPVLEGIIDKHALHDDELDEVDDEEELEFLAALFGKNMDGEDIEEEEYAEEDVADFFDFTAGRGKGSAQNNKKKKKPTKSELEMQEAVKDIRTVYTALVKILHPDAEADEQKRAEKTELMKQVTLLYNDKNYFGLLRLYMMHGGSEVDTFGKASEMRLKNYIRLLDEQLLDLRRKLSAFRHNGPNAVVYFRFFKPDTTEISTYKFNKEKNNKKKTLENMHEFYLFAKDKKLFKKELKDLIADYNSYLY